MVRKSSRRSRTKRRGGGIFRGTRRGGARRGGTHRGRKRRGGARRGGAQRAFKASLHKLAKLRPTQRVQAMKAANNAFIRHMSREVKKLRCKRVSPALRRRFSKHSTQMRRFTSNKTSMKEKRRLLGQRGGILPLILAGLAGTLASSILR